MFTGKEWLDGWLCIEMTVLVVEQNLPFVRRVCDRSCIRDKGRVVSAGAMPELTDELVRMYLTV